MFKATKLIAAAMEESGLKYVTGEAEGVSFVKLGVDNDAGVPEEYYFISKDDNNDVAIRSCAMDAMPRIIADTGLRLLNALNSEYRYARFCLDSDNNVILQADLPIETPDADVGRCALEMLILLNKIYNQAYPRVRDFIWS